MTEPATADRRPLASRQSPWALRAAQWLACRGVRPNTISLMTILFGFLAMAGFWTAHVFSFAPTRTAALLFAAMAMQLRLVCNLLDGMVAVEAGAGATRAGEIYNDLPDRIADVLIFTGAGVCAGGISGISLGLAAAIGAVLTAYIRVLGKTCGARSHFAGPMAKQHRMAVLTVACLIGAVVVWFGWLHLLLRGVLALIVAGCAITCVNRLRLIGRDLEAV